MENKMIDGILGHLTMSELDKMSDDKINDLLIIAQQDDKIQDLSAENKKLRAMRKAMMDIADIVLRELEDGDES
jgi:hypothetical protein